MRSALHTYTDNDERRHIITDRFCTNCGEKITGAGKFCANCGAAVEGGGIPAENIGPMTDKPAVKNKKAARLAALIGTGIAVLIVIVAAISIFAGGDEPGGPFEPDTPKLTLPYGITPDMTLKEATALMLDNGYSKLRNWDNGYNYAQYFGSNIVYGYWTTETAVIYFHDQMRIQFIHSYENGTDAMYEDIKAQLVEEYGEPNYGESDTMAEWEYGNYELSVINGTSGTISVFFMYSEE